MHINASNAILTKSRARYGRRLTASDLREMSALTKLSDAAAFLKNRTHYASGLNDVKESAVHRDNLELLLRRKMFLDFARLCRFERSVGEHVYQYLLLRGDVNELLRFLRFFLSGRPQDYLFAMPDFFNRHTALDLVALSKVKTYEDFLSVIPDPELTVILRAFTPQDNDFSTPQSRAISNREVICESIDYTMIEAALDANLYTRFCGILDRHFRGWTRRELKLIFSRKAELDNIKLIYRAKKYYQSEPDTIRAKLTPVQNPLIGQKQLNALMSASTPEEFLNLLRTTPYGRAFGDFNEDAIDLAADRFLYRQARKYMRFSNNPAMVMACCILLFEFEIDDVTNIIEGIRYNLPPEEIEKLLIQI